MFFPYVASYHALFCKKVWFKWLASVKSYQLSLKVSYEFINYTDYIFWYNKGNFTIFRVFIYVLPFSLFNYTDRLKNKRKRVNNYLFTTPKILGFVLFYIYKLALELLSVLSDCQTEFIFTLPVDRFKVMVRSVNV